MSIGDKIRQRRKELGMTQSELGKRIHKSSQVVSNWERGYTTGITAEDLQQLGAALDTDVHFFVPSSSVHFPWGLMTAESTNGYLRKASPDGRLKTLIEAYPRLDEKSKNIIEAIVKLSK